jgi:5'-3' exonuclease
MNKESDAVLVYGLDADLIMLSLAHLPVCPRIYLYRDKDNDLVKDHFLDIPELALRLEIPSLDYLLIGFFLGNDFMPKFPSLCIRTDGIQRLMSAYAQAGDKTLVEGKTIIWRNVRRLIAHLAANEHAFLLEEYAHRRKQAKYIKTDDQATMYPMLEREVEEYIAPEKPFWQDRYYQTLFKIRPTPERKRQIALNYLEGLEWTLRYYVDGCPDWGWTYKYEYPPLLEDLLACVPYFETEFIGTNKRGPVTAAEQLAYVMPTPGVVYETQHAFCRFDWESHVLVPPFGSRNS